MAISAPITAPMRFDGDFEEAPPSPTLPMMPADDSSIIGNYATKVKRLEEDLEAANKTIDAIKRLFNPEQIELLLGLKKHVVYSDKTITQDIETYYLCGTSGYEHLLKRGFPFASISTLNRHMKNLTICPGKLNESAYKLAELKARNMDENQKEVSLIIDQMSIQQRIEWDQSNKRLSGHITFPRKCDEVPEDIDSEGKPLDKNFLSTALANSVQVYMLAGLKDRHKTEIGHDLTTGSLHGTAFANRIKRLVRETRQKTGQRISSLAMAL